MIRRLSLPIIVTLAFLAPAQAAARHPTPPAPRAGPTDSALPPAKPTAGEVHLLVPAYFGPAEGWAAMCSEMPAGSTAIVNPESGPGSAKQSSYSSAITGCNSDGQKVIGYVYTEEGHRSISTVEAQIADYYSWYPVGGIFLDGMAEAPDTSYYATLESFIHAKGGIVVGNPGDTASTDWQLGVVDQVVVFEGSASEFAHYEPATWVTAAAPSRIAIIVYSATVGACSTAEADNAGSVFVTNLSEPNPYGALPSYWTTETEKCATPLPSASQGTWTGAVGSAGYDLAAWAGRATSPTYPTPA